MVAGPLEGRIGKAHVVLAVGGEVAKIGKGEGDAGLKVSGETRTERGRAIDHHSRGIEAEGGAGSTALGKFDGMFTGAAAEVDDAGVAREGEAREDHRDGFVAVTAKAVVKIWIPISHCEAAIRRSEKRSALGSIRRGARVNKTCCASGARA